MTNTRYVDVDADVGGDGTTNALTGANCAYKSLNIWEAARQAVLSDIEECVCESNGGSHTADTTSVTINGWTTTAAYYINIHTSVAGKHTGIYSATKYRLTIVTQDVNGITIVEPDVIINGLQVYMGISPILVECSGIAITCADANIDIKICNNIIRGVASNTNYLSGIFDMWLSGSGTCRVWNNIVYGFSATRGLGIDFSVLNSYLYNNTVVNCGYGIAQEGGTCIAINNLSYDNTTTFDFSGTFTTSNYNFSKDDSAPGANSIYGDTDGKTPDFVAGGYLIESTSDAINAGTDNPGSGLYNNSITDKLRTTPWDIGADEYRKKYSFCTII